jgi:hypothetical protein
LGYIIYIHTWKCHKKIPHVAILNKQKYHFFKFTKSENRRVEQVLGNLGVWYQWEGGGGEERA